MCVWMIIWRQYANFFLNSKSSSFSERLDWRYWRKRVDVPTFRRGRTCGRSCVVRWWIPSMVGRISWMWVWGRRRGWGLCSCRNRGWRWRQKPGLVLDLSKSIWMMVDAGKQHPFLVVGTTQNLVVIQIELITDTEPGEKMFSLICIYSDGIISRVLCYLCPHCWQAKHSKWYTFVLALITISKAGITLLQAEQ